ncbi:glycosyltransferase family 2 protein [uncultured Faecalibaculum sp.]|uniref:glycosyltransferase family 2 protein n=1 Tax=uncultured Faecalibaculum sp. TaxID=1729681 RepID=UPI002618188B|nr:glycosyltransferase family 2 protein [uncultured Faecalibaculum sp.]
MISVAMAVYNGEKYLKDQLDSILNQTTPVDEIVIVDDKSTDATTDIIREYQLKNPQIRLFLNDKNIGYRENFRKAVSLCHGELTFLCDQDDRWDPKKVEIMSRIMENDKAIKVLASSFQFMDSSGSPYAVKLRRGMSNNNMYLKPVRVNDLVPVSFEEFCSHNYFQGCSMAINLQIRNEFVENGSHSRLPHDWLIALIASHKKGFYFLNQPLFFYRIHASNTIGVPKGQKKEEWVRLKFAEDMLDAARTAQALWPQEYGQDLGMNHRIRFCIDHIDALKKRSFFKLLAQNLDPVYGELKSYRARAMDLLFAMTSKGTTDV